MSSIVDIPGDIPSLDDDTPSPTPLPPLTTTIGEEPESTMEPSTTTFSTPPTPFPAIVTRTVTMANGTTYSPGPGHPGEHRPFPYFILPIGAISILLLVILCVMGEVMKRKYRDRQRLSRSSMKPDRPEVRGDNPFDIGAYYSHDIPGQMSGSWEGPYISNYHRQFPSPEDEFPHSVISSAPLSPQSQTHLAPAPWRSATHPGNDPKPNSIPDWTIPEEEEEGLEVDRGVIIPISSRKEGSGSEGGSGSVEEMDDSHDRIHAAIHEAVQARSGLGRYGTYGTPPPRSFSNIV